MENQTIDRKFNFALLRYLHGTHKNLVEELRGIANWNDISDFALGHRPIGEHRARAIEGRLKLPDHWLDRDHRTDLDADAGAYGLHKLTQGVPAEVRQAIKTILEKCRSGSARSEVHRTAVGVQLSLVKKGESSAATDQG